MSSALVAETAARLEREIAQEIQMAQMFLYETSYADEQFAGKMSAALAHSNIALIKRHELNVLLAEETK